MIPDTLGQNAGQNKFSGVERKLKTFGGILHRVPGMSQVLGRKERLLQALTLFDSSLNPATVITPTTVTIKLEDVKNEPLQVPEIAQTHAVPTMQRTLTPNQDKPAIGTLCIS